MGQQQYVISGLQNASSICGMAVLNHSTGPDVIKLFQALSMKFQLLIKTKIPTNKEVSCFKSLSCCIYHANKC